jgi:hypothetical protein
MTHKPLRLLPAALLAAGMLFTISPAGRIGLAAVQAAEAVKPEIATHLKAAASLINAHRFKEALVKVHEAEAVPNKTAAEQFVIDRALGSAAMGAGDYATATQAFGRVMSSGKLSAAEREQIAAALAGAEYSQGHYAKAIQWAKEAGNAPGMHQLVIQASYQSGDYATVARTVGADVAADEKAGRKPSDTDLQLLANAYQHTNNSAGLTSTMEKLLTYYPKKEYWADVLTRVQRKSGFSGRFALDVFRLELVTGNLTKAEDYMEAAQLALEAGLPTEGKKILDKGFAAKVLGTGADAARQKRLLDLAAKRETDAQASLAADATKAQAEKDGNDLVKIGYRYVTLGQADKGVELMQQGIAKDDLKRPEDAKLHLGLALLQAGKKAKALQTLRSVQGNDGASDIAHLWILAAGQGLLPS